MGVGGVTLLGNWVVVDYVGVGWDIKNVLLHARLEPYTTAQVKHTTLLSSWINLKFIYTNYIIS